MTFHAFIVVFIELQHTNRSKSLYLILYMEASVAVSTEDLIWMSFSDNFDIWAYSLFPTRYVRLLNTCLNYRGQRHQADGAISLRGISLQGLPNNLKWSKVQSQIQFWHRWKSILFSWGNNFCGKYKISFLEETIFQEIRKLFFRWNTKI
jgi:hypothetical protein